LNRSQSLDAFLGAEEPCATFHDAKLVSLLIDYERMELLSEWQLCVGDPRAPDRPGQERSRRGRLRFTGLCFWVVDPPEGLLNGSHLPWLTSDGPLADARTDTAKKLAGLLPSEAKGWYLFFWDWNAFAYCGATGASFEWVR
jgi:hypothetical protein